MSLALFRPIKHNCPLRSGGAASDAGSTNAGRQLRTSLLVQFIANVVMLGGRENTGSATNILGYTTQQATFADFILSYYWCIAKGFVYSEPHKSQKGLSGRWLCRVSKATARYMGCAHNNTRAETVHLIPISQVHANTPQTPTSTTTPTPLAF